MNKNKKFVTIVLTQGLLESYLSLIVSLDGTPLDQLNIDTLIIHLLNKEAHQLGFTMHTITLIPKVEFSDNIALYTGSRATLRAHMHSVKTFYNIDEILWVRDPDFDLVEDRKCYGLLTRAYELRILRRSSQKETQKNSQ
jgi:hypothetical protein